MGAFRELADGVSQQSKLEAASSSMSNWETIISFIVPIISVLKLQNSCIIFFPPCVGVKFLFKHFVVLRTQSMYLEFEKI